MKTRQEVIDFCLSLDDTYEDYPSHDFNWTIMRHKGNQKMFAAIYEHHVMVGASLLTAYKNAGGEIDLQTALSEMQARGKQVPGGACGFWGACGAGISTGMYMSIITKSTPLAKEAWGLSNQMTGQALTAIGKNGGPRCCKRDSYIAIIEAAKFTAENLGVHMELDEIECSRFKLNNQCVEEGCPFHVKN